MIHQVIFSPNAEEAQFKNIYSSFECIFTNWTFIDISPFTIDFPRYPNHLMPLRDVRERPNKYFVDIARIVVHYGEVERIGRYPCDVLYREVTFMDSRFNLMTVGIWGRHLTENLFHWSTADANKHIILGTMLQQDKKYGCLNNSEHTTLAFNPKHAPMATLRTIRRSLVIGDVNMNFVKLPSDEDAYT